MALEDLRYNENDVVVGLTTITVANAVELALEGQKLKVLKFDWDRKAYLVEIFDGAFCFYLTQGELENENWFVPVLEYETYNALGSVIHVRTPKNRLRAYTIEEIISDSDYDNYMTLKLKACD